APPARRSPASRRSASTRERSSARGSWTRSRSSRGPSRRSWRPSRRRGSASPEASGGRRNGLGRFPSQSSVDGEGADEEEGGGERDRLSGRGDGVDGRRYGDGAEHRRP